MSAQSAMQGLAGTIVGGAATIAMGAKKLGAGDKDKKEVKPSGSKDSGIDMKMAIKARKNLQQKANAIYMNKEISNKAKTRRLGKALDEYTKEIGGKK